ncbi:MAG TPA: DUF4193 family protein [Actinomycetota bacterium]|nr:DUF4193 family protein [Actinomycetota bacterium]
MEDIEDTLDDEELEEPEEASEDVGGAEPTAPPARASGSEDVESIQELLVKQEARAEEEEDAEESVLTLTRDELRDESIAVKVMPPQANEFTCRNCYLVKHRSQLRDKAKMLCRDCA